MIAYVLNMVFLKTLTSRITGRTRFPSSRVEGPIYAIGDIHGCADLLERLFILIEQDVAKRPYMGPTKIVYVGDYIDRGDQSFQVLKRLYALQQADPDRHVCLKGNHEDMLLKFLSKPEKHGPRWLRYGGMQTLASLGVRGIREQMSPSELSGVAVKVWDILGEDIITWLQNMPLTYQSGNVVCVHAGLDPHQDLDHQAPSTCMWGYNTFLKHPRRDGQWVLHGHTIVDQVHIAQGRMSIDTGAYATGRLTALGLYGNQSWVLTAFS